MKIHTLDTLLGPMVGIANEKTLFLLEFADRQELEKKIEQLASRTKSTIVSGYTSPIYSIEKELGQYFEGKLKEFTTPLFLFGSHFQQRVWEDLRKIPYGKTISYADLAITTGCPTSYRAVARANGANPFAILIPCHRVINKNGMLGGYSGGTTRKKWLIRHETAKL